MPPREARPGPCADRRVAPSWICRAASRSPCGRVFADWRPGPLTAASRAPQGLRDQRPRGSLFPPLATRPPAAGPCAPPLVPGVLGKTGTWMQRDISPHAPFPDCEPAVCRVTHSAPGSGGGELIHTVTN